MDLSYNTDLQSNNSSLQVILDKIMQLPDSSGLIAEYQMCDYIQSNGAQWIDTGWVHGSDSVIVLDCNISLSNRDTYLALFGSMNPNYNTNAWTLFVRYNGQDVPALARTGNETTGSGMIYGSRITIIANGTKSAWTTGSSTNSVTSSGNANNGVVTMALFTNHEGTSFRRHSVMTLYGAKFYKSGVLERDFVPAKRNADGIYGLYDRVNKVFYKSIGTQEFNGG